MTLNLLIAFFVGIIIGQENKNIPRLLPFVQAGLIRVFALDKNDGKSNESASEGNKNGKNGNGNVVDKGNAVNNENAVVQGNDNDAVKEDIFTYFSEYLYKRFKKQ